MNKYVIHFFKILKSILIRPVKTFNWIRNDFKKDFNSKNHKSIHKLVWCAGLPKSGSTLIEKIFDYLPYVRQDSSFNRLFFTGKLDHDHGISDQMFENNPQDKFTFLKTHTHYDEKYEKIALKYNSRIIISLRDIRDMLISRYYHIMSYDKHWLHNEIKNLDFTKGFIASVKAKENFNSPNVLDYYYNWINNWVKISKDRKYLILWYEQYRENPIQYIKKILDYVDFKHISAQEINSKIILNNEKKISLNKSLKGYGRDVSTFRKGKVGEWKEYFNDEINEYFFLNLPGDIKDVTYKGN